MTSAHSILPPSGAKAWKVCAAWPTMNALYPKPATPESAEGDAAHWVFAEMLAARAVGVGSMAPNGIYVTDEMMDGAEMLVDFVRDHCADFSQLHVEESVSIVRINEQCWGTPDVWWFDRSQMQLDVVDYKFGHRFVDEYENDQGISYTTGILERLAEQLGVTIGQLDEAVRVRITIIQPRCYYKGSPVRSWSVNASYLRAHVNHLARAAQLALEANPTATTNSECGDCGGRHACAALQQAAYSDAEFAVQSVPVELSSQAASLELKMLERALERLTSRVEGLRESVTAYARQGHVVPFHRLEQTSGRQQWTVPTEQVVSMGQLLGVDLSKPGAKTPKQAQKLGIDEAVIKEYSVTPLGAVKLVSDNPADARRVFGTTN